MPAERGDAKRRWRRAGGASGARGEAGMRGRSRASRTCRERGAWQAGRGGNASIIKGTRKRDWESAAGCSTGHVSETRPWHCKTSPGLASLPQAWPGSGAAHPGGLARWWHCRRARHPAPRPCPTSQHPQAARAASRAGAGVRGAGSAPSPLSPKKLFRGALRCFFRLCSVLVLGTDGLAVMGDAVGPSSGKGAGG